MPEKYGCPPEVTRRLTEIGGNNPFGEPLFRCVWGWNRIVKMTGQWWDEKFDVMGPVETREVPKYLPADRWFLEMWRPPEEYGSPETWGKLGEEVVGNMTVDTAGPFPSRGEYELCYVISPDLQPPGDFLPLSAGVVGLLVSLIKASRKETLSGHQRESAIKQRLFRERTERINQTCAELI